MVPKRCEHCKAELFEAIPFKTTQRELVEFAQRSTWLKEEAVLASRWIHPGIYCPNGCTQILHEYRIHLPEMTIREAIAIGQQYSQKHHQEFIETHGAASRIVACVYCRNFDGAVLTGWHNTHITHIYREPKYRPLRNHKVAQAYCRAPEIQQLEGAWWYDRGDKQPECDSFQYDDLFKHVYKDVTGWREYPEA